jgi:hypothetical protein
MMKKIIIIIIIIFYCNTVFSHIHLQITQPRKMLSHIVMWHELAEKTTTVLGLEEIFWRANYNKKTTSTFLSQRKYFHFCDAAHNTYNSLVYVSAICALRRTNPASCCMQPRWLVNTIRESSAFLWESFCKVARYSPWAQKLQDSLSFSTRAALDVT